MMARLRCPSQALPRAPPWRRLTNVAGRADWPVPVLKRVLQQLMQETPRDLLAREQGAPGAGEESSPRVRSGRLVMFVCLRPFLPQ